MASPRKVRDPDLIDALDRMPRRVFAGTVWRIVREGRDPVQCSASGGRWDDGTFDVLYTSLERQGALAEMHFHLSRGQPVFPTKLRFGLHELRVELKEVLDFPAAADLLALGLDASLYGQALYENRQIEYPRTQDIAEAAHFLGCDGILVPSARHACQNAVLFCAHVSAGAVSVIREHGPVDWKAFLQGAGKP